MWGFAGASRDPYSCLSVQCSVLWNSGQLTALPWVGVRPASSVVSLILLPSSWTWQKRALSLLLPLWLFVECVFMGLVCYDTFRVQFWWPNVGVHFLLWFSFYKSDIWVCQRQVYSVCVCACPAGSSWQYNLYFLTTCRHRKATQNVLSSVTQISVCVLFFSFSMRPS